MRNLWHNRRLPLAQQRFRCWPLVLLIRHWRAQKQGLRYRLSRL